MALRDNLTNNHKSLDRSKLDYGSICNGNSNSNIIKILDPVHNARIRCTIGAFRHSPIASSILVITGEPPPQYGNMKLSLNI